MKVALGVAVVIQKADLPEGVEWVRDERFPRRENVFRAVVAGVEYRKWTPRTRERFARIDAVGGELNLAEPPRKASWRW